MAKFLFVYRSAAEQPTEAPSPEQMQAVMQKWGEWFQKAGAAVVDGGDALLPTGKLITAQGAVTDGPFIEAKEMVGGFSIFEAENYDAAADIAKGCPILENGGSVEIREMACYDEQ